MTEFAPFDAAEYLETEEDIAAFLEEASEGSDPGAIALALGAVARARNISQLARDVGMTRMGVYKALNHGGNPSLETVAKIADALGFKLALQPKAPRPTVLSPELGRKRSRQPASEPVQPPTRRTGKRRAVATA